MRGARLHEDEAWQKLFEIYGPFLYSRLRHKGVSEADAADIVQDAFWAASRSLPDFQQNDRQHSFRAWIWVVTRNKMQDHFGKRCHRIQASGGTDAQIQLMQYAVQQEGDEVEDHANEINAALIHRIKEIVREEFTRKTFDAFLMTTQQERTGQEAAAELGMTVGAVYKAKSRVLTRIRQLMDNPFNERRNL